MGQYLVCDPSQIMSKALVLLCAVLGVAFGASIESIKPTETFNNSVTLDHDGNYFLFWNFNSSHVTFEIHVKTKGWVGFGLSDNGNMYPGDVVVGWVDNNGVTTFSDRHTKGHVMPIKDASQDWHLLHGEENDFGTVLKFVRKIETCDTTDDLIIPAGTTRLIFAYGQADPASEDGITYHMTTRGTKSVPLLSTLYVPDDLPTDVIHFDFLNGNYLLPNATTTYFCKGFFLPEFGKHHMIKFEPVITPGNELNVHHIVIYRCSNVNRSVSENAEGECYGSRPESFPQECGNVFIAWAIGGEAFYFPEDVGFPVQERPNMNDYFLMETHYDNPTQRTGVIDNSGVRMTLTKQFRRQEAGLLQLGQDVNTYQMIPPGEEAFVSSGFCTEECINEGFKQSNLQEVKAFSLLQHSHLLGSAMKTRHFRNGTEIKPLADEPAYDFNFQEFRLFDEEIPIRPGDAFTVDCIYDSTKRQSVTFGGLSTQDEMCLTFVYIYPALKVSSCISVPIWDNYHLPPQMLIQKMRSSDWSDKAFVDDFKHKLNTTNHYHGCDGEHLQDVDLAMTQEPTPRKPYVPPAPKCSRK